VSRHFRTFLLIVLGALACACAMTPEELEDIPLKPVRHVDLDRYMGRWYIVANIPYFAERGNVAPYVQYTRRPDGMIDDLYTARDGFDKPEFTKNGLIEVTDSQHFAEGRITFLPPLWQDYTVMYVDDDYRYTVIGHPSRNFCWVFSREPRVDEQQYEKMIAVLADNKFDVSRVLKIPQNPAEVGAPGFQ
jgi:apolipoprotein D and lipocalin family protein